VEVLPEKTVADVRLPLLLLQLPHAVVRLSGLWGSPPWLRGWMWSMVLAG